MDEQPKRAESRLGYLFQGWILLILVLGVLQIVSQVSQITLRAPSDSARFLNNAPRFQLDVNSATAAQLQALPDVGVRLADRIVTYRETNGPFRDLYDLQKVRGVGPATIERLLPMLLIMEPGTQSLPLSELPATDETDATETRLSSRY